MLHVVNNLSIPVSFWGSKSVQVFAGVQDAMTQWWYGHNAVGFFLTAGFLGMMYYFVPKQADRPVYYSYKLSIMSLLGSDFPLYLGGSAPFALHGFAGLGGDPWHGVFNHPLDAELGRYDQRFDDAARRMGQVAHRSDFADVCSVAWVLWHVHL